jgi:predicted XRE-type DNA-binding protein
MKTKETITLSSGNVFPDLGLSNPEELQLKARLTHLITQIIEQRELTPQQVAKALGIKRSEVSKLTRDSLDDFSVGQLPYFLSRLEHRDSCKSNHGQRSAPRLKNQRMLKR